MRTVRITTAVGALAAAIMSATLTAGADNPRAGGGGDDRVGNLRISQGHTHGNLTIFLLHGEDVLKGRRFLTLQEALAEKKIVVHETGNVSELAVENVADDADVYIMSGDIVKGGKQDRTLPYDFIVPRKSGKLPIASFCVEQGRWSARKGEAVGSFGQSSSCLFSKDLKIAARSKMQQGEVWKQVAENQDKLSKNLGAEVKSGQSASSLQLTLENSKLQETTEAYLKTVGGLLAGKTDVVGYAFAINGQMNSVEMFGSAELFAKLWPKLVRATVVEAIAETKKDAKFEAPTWAAVRACVADAEKGKSSEREVGKRLREVRQETEKTVLFDTRDKENGGASLRKSYIAK